ncbi:MAG TPA: ABATE domain-containing protein [Rhodanobacteraceae bacterium]
MPSANSSNSRFLLLGEPLALDLVNTRIRRDGQDVDLLDTPAALGAWLRAERERVAWSGTASASDLAAVRALRDAVDALLRAHRRRVRAHPHAVARVNHALGAAAGHARLRWTATGPALQPASRCAQRNALLRALAVDALALLTGADASRVRECAHPQCRLQFVARNPRRRWCSGKTCGNRARVAAHYQRRCHAG